MVPAQDAGYHGTALLQQVGDDRWIADQLFAVADDSFSELLCGTQDDRVDRPAEPVGCVQLQPVVRACISGGHNSVQKLEWWFCLPGSTAVPLTIRGLTSAKPQHQRKHFLPSCTLDAAESMQLNQFRCRLLFFDYRNPP